MRKPKTRMQVYPLYFKRPANQVIVIAMNTHQILEALHTFATFLLAQFREERAFQPLVKIVSLPELMFSDLASVERQLMIDEETIQRQEVQKVLSK